ncbi:MAG: HemK/PrmC family methyltransferase, partial [Candidatus Veblenbacteria bacterium]|nr:HemK/PrmC family methyltransferase [Candidatus Veblenbacteria bacterium]
MTRAQALSHGSALLSAPSPSPALDAEVLLAYACGCNRSELLAHLEEPLPLLRGWRFRWLIHRRWSGIPVAYLTHEKEFYGRSFYVNRYVLTPRPETELMIEAALGTIHANGSIATIIDVGTGSGCIAITLALELPHLKVLATDTSAPALAVAKKNATHYGVDTRITFLRGNLIKPLLATPYPLLSNSLLLANLPYLTTDEIKGELTSEPRDALDGSSDGLKYYRLLIEQLMTLP